MTGRPRGRGGSLLVRALVLALVISAVVVGVLVALDHFGSQPQPFRYILH